MIWWQQWLKRSVIVNLIDGSAVRGVLYRASTRHGVELRNAEYMDPTGPAPQPVDGAVFVPASRVQFIQITGV